jgi:GT2 family glycosyltransferase
MQYEITACIVLYKNKKNIVLNTINSFLNTKLSVKLFLIDNSPDDSLKDIIHDSRIEYFHNKKNIGFGAAHNIAILKSLNISKYHIVLNPDIYFEAGNIEKLFNFMEMNIEYGHIMPKILYPNGNTQYLCKKNPTPFDLFLRRFAPPFLCNIFRNRMSNF